MNAKIRESIDGAFEQCGQFVVRVDTGSVLLEWLFSVLAKEEVTHAP
jgi:hypothetical protein